MRELAEWAYHALSMALGRALRKARYATARVVREGGEPAVRKRRGAHAPALVWLGNPLLGMLDAGVRVLPQRDWERRERLLYERLHGAAIRVDADGTLVLPHLAGVTLATLLEDAELGEAVRERAVALAVDALGELHRRGFTHGDAMAENVMVDLESGDARWFDFETVHEPRRPLAWRRADDLRALLATCAVRARPERLAELVRLVVDVHADDEVTLALCASLGPAPRPLAFHLGQAGLSLRRRRELSRLLRERLGERPRAGATGSGCTAAPARGEGCPRAGSAADRSSAS